MATFHNPSYPYNNPYGGPTPSAVPNRPSSNNNPIPQSIPSSSTATPDYFNFQNVNVTPEMLNYGLYGLNASQALLKSQREKWMPGVSGFFMTLKLYFSVSNSYVLKKLQMILYPISNKNWNRILADEFERVDENEQYSRKWALPKQDANAPDLYIPLMAFITYILLIGLRRGIGSTFSPDILIQAIWRCLILQILETCLIKFGVNTMQAHVPFLDIFAYTGYKYVGLCVNTLSLVTGRVISFIVSIYAGAMLGYFILKTLAAVVPTTTKSIPPRHLILIGFAVMQGVVLMILSWM